MKYTAAQLNDAVRPIGRCIKMNDGFYAEFPCGGVEFCFVGGGDVEIGFELQRNCGMLGVVIDGDEMNVINFKVTTDDSSLVVAQGLPDGKHTVKIIKLNEFYNNTFIFKSALFDGTPERIAASNKLKIEAYGDSITCGAWNLLNFHSTKGYEAGYSEDSYRTYIAVAARRLNAELSVVSSSGWGLCLGNGENPNNVIPKIRDTVLPDSDRSIKWDFSSYIPDLVVVNLGTNDKNPPVTDVGEVCVATLEFLEDLHRKYPSCRVMWISGMMGDYDKYEAPMREIAESFSKCRTAWVTLPEDMSGGDWHPTVEGHKAAADVLVEEIKKLLDRK